MTTTLDTHTHHLRDLTAGISVTGLAKTFPGPQGPVHAVRGVDLDIAPGETVALLGPNVAKTGVRNRVEAVRVADERGWLSAAAGRDQ